jgi:hypothetical protein
MVLMIWRIYPLSDTYEGSIQERPDDAKLYLDQYIRNVRTLKIPMFLKLLRLPFTGRGS